MELPDFLTQIGLLIDLKRYDEALALITKAITQYPTQARLFLLKAFCLEKTGQSKAAEKTYLHLLELHPNSAEAHEFLAKFYFNEGEAEKAEKHVKIALQLEAHSASLLAVAALVYNARKPFKSARLLKQAKAIDPEDEMVSYADAYISVMSLKLGRLKEMIIQNAAEDPDSAQTKMGMGLVELSRNNQECAVELLKDAYLYDGEEATLEAWIDAKMLHIFPFNFLLPRIWAFHAFLPVTGQFMSYAIYIVLIVAALKHEFPIAFDQWIWLLNLPIVIIASFLYVIRFPLQLYFKVQLRQSIQFFSHRFLVQLALIYTTTVHWILLLSDSLDPFFALWFLLLYLPLWIVIEDIQTKYTKIIVIGAYAIAWLSFFVQLIYQFMNIVPPKPIVLPSLLAWILILSGFEALQNLEEKYL